MKKKYRDFSVEAVMNGFIVTMGCNKMVAITQEKVARIIAEFWVVGEDLDDPIEQLKCDIKKQKEYDF